MISKNKIRLLTIPIGKSWDPAVREQFNTFITGLPDRIPVKQEDPVFEETAILEMAESFRNYQADLVLLVALHGASARALVYTSRILDMPVAIWCHNQRHSLASSALAAEGLRQLEHPYVILPNNLPSSRDRMISAAYASAAKQRLRHLRIGQIGPLHFNLVGASVNPIVLHRRFGSWVVPIAISQIRREFQNVDSTQIQNKMQAFLQKYQITMPDKILRMAAAMELVLERLCSQNRLDVIATDCWNELMPEFGISPCLGFLENNYRISCEGDLVLAATLFAGELINSYAGYCGDLYALDGSSREITLRHCGGCAAIHSDAKKMEVISESPPGTTNANGTVVACHPILPRTTATVVMLHGDNLDQLHLRRGDILRTEFTEQMQVVVRLEGDMEAFGRELAGNHYVVFPGDQVDAWKIWAQWNNITVH